jgi:prephenate dehydrogenase
MQTVAIVGVGLIGGSFGLALRKAGFEGEIIGVSSPRAIAAALRQGAISRAMEFDDAIRRADLVYLAQPVDRILLTLAHLKPLIRYDCLITDAGSTKAQIVNKAAECLPPGQFLGGHPLAGKELRGVENADGDLFRARPYVLTPSGPKTRQAEAFRSWLLQIGAELVELSPEEHDATVALTSHLPQLLSTALAQTLANEKNKSVEVVFGQGLLDMTRLALSEPELWSSILSTNRESINAAIDNFLRTVNELRDAIGTADLLPLFHSARAFSGKIRKADCTN